MRALFTTHLSKPLKKLQVAYLDAVQNECYSEKHLSETAPNEQKVHECRGLVRDRFFGQFDHKIYLHRHSDEKKFEDCLRKAGNNLEGAMSCVEKYHS